MPYTTPNTVSGSDTLTAALWNLQIRDNFEAAVKVPNARAARSSSLVCPSGAFTSVPWDSATGAWDWTTSMRSTTVNNTRITVPEAGTYSVATNFSFYASTSATMVSASVARYNAAGVQQDIVAQTQTYVTASGNNGVSVTGLSQAASGDYFTCMVYPTSAGVTALFLGNGANQMYFTVAQVSK